MPSRLHLDTREETSAADRCLFFSDFFSSAFNHAVILIPGFNFGSNVSIYTCTITPIDVQWRLEALNHNKGAGPDDIPPVVLKYCAHILAPHFAIYFSSLLAQGIFPSVLKSGFALPIFKSGDCGNVRNYRPIVIQSVIAKVYESIILDYLYFQLRGFILSAQLPALQIYDLQST